MHISPLEEYGLRCALQLARDTGKVTSASAIAEREGLSVEYVSKLLFSLRKGGAVKASRGTQGGFSLAAAPSDISLKQVFDALNSATGRKAAATFCGDHAGKLEACTHVNNCSIRPVWELLSHYFNEVLKTLTLADLLEKEQSAFVQIQSVAAAKADLIRDTLKERKRFGCSQPCHSNTPEESL